MDWAWAWPEPAPCTWSWGGAWQQCRFCRRCWRSTPSAAGRLADREDWLERLTTGEAYVAAPWRSPRSASCRATRRGAISPGRRAAVQSADRASHVLVCTTGGDCVALVPLEQSGRDNRCRGRPGTRPGVCSMCSSPMWCWRNSSRSPRGAAAQALTAQACHATRFCAGGGCRGRRHGAAGADRGLPADTAAVRPAAGAVPGAQTSLRRPEGVDRRGRRRCCWTVWVAWGCMRMTTGSQLALNWRARRQNSLPARLTRRSPRRRCNCTVASA